MVVIPYNVLKSDHAQLPKGRTWEVSGRQCDGNVLAILCFHKCWLYIEIMNVPYLHT